MISKVLRFGIFSGVGVALIVLIAIGVERGIKSLDSMLIPCQHGTPFVNGQCSCVDTPFTGEYCGKCNCAHGFCTLGGTTKKITSDYGCRCPQGSKFFGFLCDQCNVNSTDPGLMATCNAPCADGYFGTHCNRKCFSNVNYYDTLSMNATGDEGVCRDLRLYGGSCNACSGHGSCYDGRCQCEPNWFDDQNAKCSLTCPITNGKMCSGHGSCKLYGQTPGCLCEFGWRGTDCSIKCPGMAETGKPCSGHGSCLIDWEQEPAVPSCQCNEKYRGESCDVECPGEYNLACSGHGTCDAQGTCLCQVSPLEWTGIGCNCTDILSCNSRGSCVDGACVCEQNFDGVNCLQCKPNWWGSTCQFYCDRYGETTETTKGCYSNGECTVFNMDTIYESVGCECDLNEVEISKNGRKQIFRSYFSSDLDCSECTSGYFPKIDVFNNYTMIEGLYVPCQKECIPTTCNELGTCNEMFGIPGEDLCHCDDGPDGNKHVNDSSFCLECEHNWYPDRVRDDTGCTNFCIADLSDVGGNFPDECLTGEIDCVHCNGRGSCTLEGTCDCEEGYTGDMCQIQCLSDNGLLCGGHGQCLTDDMQHLLQYELANIEESGSLYKCVCDPQDEYTAEARMNWNGPGELEPPPRPEYFGETCDFHCIKPPWKDSEECNGLGNCTLYKIVDPGENTFTCTQDSDCEATAVQRVISGDISWHNKKGPFCHKDEFPPGCENDQYNKDDCLRILTLHRPEAARSVFCMEDALCRHTLESYDWHNWCQNVIDVQTPSLFENCGGVSQFCPYEALHPKCADYVGLSTGVTLSRHMDYCYENSKKAFPFHMNESYRLDDYSAELRDIILKPVMGYHEAYPEVDIDITPYCQKRMKKFDMHVDVLHKNERFLCGNTLLDADTCLYGSIPVVTWDPFVVKCHGQEDQRFKDLSTAILARGENCYVEEDKSRGIVPNVNAQAYGELCYQNYDCLSSNCHENTCCHENLNTLNCKSCNNIGHCGTCILHSSWNGTMCSPTTDCDWEDGIGCKDIADGQTCEIDANCNSKSCKGGKCCHSLSGENCKTCGSDGACQECIEGAVGATCQAGECTGIQTWIPDKGCTSLEDVDQIAAIKLVDDTCDSAINMFPQCFEPQNACEINACKDGDTCEPDGADAICKTTGIFDCSCKYGFECTGINLGTYRCTANFEQSSCPSEAQNFNWVGYCKDNNPIIRQFNNGVKGLNDHPMEIDALIDIKKVYTGSNEKSITVEHCKQFSEQAGYSWDPAVNVIEHNGFVQGCFFNNYPGHEKYYYNTPNSCSGSTVNGVTTTCTCNDLIGSWSAECIQTGWQEPVKYLTYWTKPTSISSPSGVIELNSGEDTIARVYMVQGQIQLNMVNGLEACPLENPTCLETWAYEPNQWTKLEVEIDYLTRLVKLRNQNGDEKAAPFVCTNCHSIETVDNLKITQGASTTYFDEVLVEKEIDKPSLFESCNQYSYCDMNVNYRQKCSDILLHLSFPSLIEPSYDIIETCKNNFEYESFSDYSLTNAQQDSIELIDWNYYCLFSENVKGDFDCGGHNYTWFEEYNYCRNKLSPMTSKQCMTDALTYDWDNYCDSLITAAIPLDIKDNCPAECYAPLKHYNKCEDRAALYNSNDGLVGTTCSADWYKYCHDVAQNKDEGHCTAVECACEWEKYEGASGPSCELHCLVGADGSACGEETGVGKCVPTDRVQAILDAGTEDDEGNLIAYDKQKFELPGKCDCFLSEGEANCDVPCYNCNEGAYNEIIVSPTNEYQYSGDIQDPEHANLAAISYSSISVGQSFVIDMYTEDIITGALIEGDDSNGIKHFNISVSEDNVLWEQMPCGEYIICNGTTNKEQTAIQIKGYGRWVKVVVLETFSGTSTNFHFGLKITRAGQYGSCDGSRGVCECLPPFTTLVEKKYINWRGQERKKRTRVHYLPDAYDDAEEFRIRAMQGKEVFITKYLKSMTIIEPTSGAPDLSMTETECEVFANSKQDYSFQYLSSTSGHPRGCFRSGNIVKYANDGNWNCHHSTICIQKEVTLAYDGTVSWHTIYEDFRDNPTNYYCGLNRQCVRHDFILLGNLDVEGQFNYNYDCNSECPGTDPGTKITCSGHGSCAVTGDCMCDPAAIIKGTNAVTGASRTFIIGGEEYEQSEYEVSGYDRTGWRGPECDKMCVGYDPVEKSMLNVCGGHGICNDEAECECEIGYTGESCQFICPGFEEGEINVCSGHGTCTLNLIEIVSDNTGGSGISPINCGGTWSSWSECDGTRQRRDFTITTQPQYGGIACPITPEFVGCILPNVDCDGTWSSWTECDGSYESRTFTITTQPERFGLACPSTPEIRVCTLPKVDCDGTWSAWSACDAATLTQTRSFTVTQQPANGGLECPNVVHTIDCSDDQLNCEGSWSQWSECNMGTRQRTYTVTQQPTLNGMPCPQSPETATCTTCTANSKCVSNTCLGGQCCNSDYALCARCDNNGYCMECIAHATTQIDGNCACDDGYIYDNSECKITWTVKKEPMFNTMGTWSDWTSCKVEQVDDTQGVQTRVRSKTVTLQFSNVDNKHFYVDYINDPHFQLEMKMVDNSGYSVPYVDTYASVIELSRVTTNYPMRIVSEYDCPTCSTGDWDTEPTSTIINADGTLLPDIEYGGGIVSWSVSNADVSDLVLPVINVTVVNGIFVLSPPLSVVEFNREYKFDQSDPSNTNHPFRFSLYSNMRIEHGVVKTSGSAGSEGAYVIIKPNIHQNKIYSYCTIHGFSMGKTYDYGKIGGAGTYYAITPDSSRMIVKFSVVSPTQYTGDYEAYQKQNCNLIAENGDCVASRECTTKACVPYAFGNKKACNANRLCAKADEVGCVQCAANTNPVLPCECKQYHSPVDIGDNLQECQNLNRRRFMRHPQMEKIRSKRYTMKSSKCGKDTVWKDGYCMPVDCEKHYGRPHLEWVSGRGCVHRLGSTSCSSDSDCSSNSCIGGVCCNAAYDTPANCLKCNDGTNAHIYLGQTAYMNGSPSPAYPGPYGYEEAIQICDEFDACTGITSVYLSNQWNIHTTAGFVEDPNYVSFEKIVQEDVYCEMCVPGSIYMRSRHMCMPLPCPNGQEWVKNVGCTAVAGAIDYKMQIPIQAALDASFCSAGFYRDNATQVCLRIEDHPIIPVTLYIDEGTVDEINMTFYCEVWANNIVKCPQCSCFFDYIYGKWSSFECETCLKGFGKRQCRTSCPSYDGETDITMCSGFGMCNFGSSLSPEGERMFLDSSCTCGNPPGSLNERETEMQLYNTFYTELTTVTETAGLMRCHDQTTVDVERKDVCYHFSPEVSDCSACTANYSGYNCQYQCEKCLMGGSCDNSPSNLRSSTCICKEVFGIQPGLWSFNCCPVGFRVTDIVNFNKMPQTNTDENVLAIDDISLGAEYNYDLTMTKPKPELNADYWCRPCPGVADDMWLQPTAQYAVCGGIFRGECERKDDHSNRCRCMPGNGGDITKPEFDFIGEACRCNNLLDAPFKNLQTDYGCAGIGTCLDETTTFEAFPKIYSQVVSGPSDQLVSLEECINQNDRIYGQTWIASDVSVFDFGSNEFSVTSTKCSQWASEKGYPYTTQTMPSRPPGCYIDMTIVNSVSSGPTSLSLDATQCEEYTIEQGQSWTSRRVSSTTKPPGCFRDTSNNIYFNTFTASTIGCSSTYRCVRYGTVTFNNVNTPTACSETYQCVTVSQKTPNEYNTAGLPTGCTWQLNANDGDGLYFFNHNPNNANCTTDYQCVKKIDDIYARKVKTTIACAPPSGYYTKFDINTGTSEMTPADLGHYVPNDGALHIEPIPCPPGQYNDIIAQTSCKTCGAGRFSTGGYIECMPCLPGYYEPSTGSDQCDSCPQGKYNELNGRTAIGHCLNCPKGKSTLAFGSAYCTDCIPGKYADVEASPGCKECAKGYYSDEHGLHNCKACAGGKYSDVLGIVICKSCTPGFHQDQTAQLGCKQCQNGKFSDGNDFVTCTDCIKGEYNNDVQQTSCIQCQDGQYQDQEGQTSCKECDQGKISDFDGAEECEDCPKGKYQDEKGKQVCPMCNAGQYADSTGTKYCAICASGKYSDVVGSETADDCTPCPRGYYCPGNFPGQKCSLGYYQDQLSQTSCKEVAIGHYTNAEGSSSQTRGCTKELPGSCAGVNSCACYRTEPKGAGAGTCTGFYAEQYYYWDSRWVTQVIEAAPCTYCGYSSCRHSSCGYENYHCQNCGWKYCWNDGVTCGTVWSSCVSESCTTTCNNNCPYTQGQAYSTWYVSVYCPFGKSGSCCRYCCAGAGPVDYGNCNHYASSYCGWKYCASGGTSCGTVWDRCQSYSTSCTCTANCPKSQGQAIYCTREKYCQNTNCFKTCDVPCDRAENFKQFWFWADC